MRLVLLLVLLVLWREVRVLLVLLLLLLRRCHRLLVGRRVVLLLVLLLRGLLVLLLLRCLVALPALGVAGLTLPVVGGRRGFGQKHICGVVVRDEKRVHKRQRNKKKGASPHLTTSV